MAKPTGAATSRALLALAAGLTAGCSAELNGDVRLDGVPMNLVDCQAGQALGFSGVQFEDGAGRLLRVGGNLDGTADAAVFEAGRVTGDDLGRCGVLAMYGLPLRINGVRATEGVAWLSCATNSHSLAGTVHFKYCH